MRRLTNGLRTSVHRFWGDQQGVTLAEALVALAIFGISAGIFIMTMATSTKAVMVSQNRIAAESLAKSQMENIKNQEYDDINNTPLYTELDPADIPAGYDFIITTERLDPIGDGLGTDDGLQKITVVVEHNGEEAFQLVSYKLNR